MYKKEQVKEWSDILQWELERVKPDLIFCVGGKSYNAIKMLQRENKINITNYSKIWHYSARGSDEEVREKILSGINKVNVC